MPARRVVPLVILLGALLVPAAPAAANTDVDVDGDDVRITVHIDCVGCKGKRGPDGSTRHVLEEDSREALE